MITIKATIFFEATFWVGIFERTDQEKYAAVRHIFGKEPTDPEIYNFVLHDYSKLKFGKPQEFQLQIKRINPKRAQREVRREMEKFKEENRSSTFSQDYIREELEQKKLERKANSSAQKKERKELQFQLKQEKKKKKQKGH